MKEIKMTEEKKIEQELIKEVKAMGGICYKFMSPGRKHVPDRLCVLPKGIIFFVECKKEDEEPRSGQYRELVRLRDMDHHAYYVNSFEHLHALLTLMRKEIEDEPYLSKELSVVYDRATRQEFNRSEANLMIMKLILKIRDMTKETHRANVR